jgi:hypothetical protein
VIRRLRRIPAPLALVLAMATAVSVAWCVVVPPFQGPDEAPHFLYTQRIVERQAIPFVWHARSNPPGVSPNSAEVRTALVQAGFGPLAGNLGARPYWTSADVGEWRRADRALGADAREDGGYTSSFRNPPLYYLYQSVPYGIAHGGSVFDRLMLMRLANVPLLLVALVFVWLLAGELVGRGWPQVVATACAALLPQMQNVAATVDPDILIVAEWSAALYLMILVLRRGPSAGRVGLLALLCVAAVLTHGRSLPLLLPAVLAVVIAVARTRGWRRVTPVRATLVTGGLYLFVVAVAAGYGSGSLRQFLSYVWQFYLPRLGFMEPSISPAGYGFRQAVPDRLYGALAQLEVTLPHGWEQFMYWLSLAALVALVAALVCSRDAIRAHLAEALVLGVAVVALVLGLHLASYRALLGTTDPVFTARYLLPLIPLFGVAIVLIARLFPRPAIPVVCGAVVGLGVILQLESFGLLLERFYA